jgi:rhodanese-related sulfurtransferase
MAELPRRVDEVEWGDDVVVACPIGQSSIQAARLIGSYEGVDDDSSVRSMAGGYDEWEYDLETEE